MSVFIFNKCHNFALNKIWMKSLFLYLFTSKFLLFYLCTFCFLLNKDPHNLVRFISTCLFIYPKIVTNVCCTQLTLEVSPVIWRGFFRSITSALPGNSIKKFLLLTKITKSLEQLVKHLHQVRGYLSSIPGQEIIKKTFLVLFTLKNYIKGFEVSYNACFYFKVKITYCNLFKSIFHLLKMIPYGDCATYNLWSRRQHTRLSPSRPRFDSQIGIIFLIV